MVDSDHPTSGLTAEAVLALLDQGDAVSLIENGRDRLSFSLRPAARRTPATIKVLIDCAYLDAGWLRPRAVRLEPLPRKFKQAPLDCFERLEVYRLFDQFLLKRALLDGIVLWPAKGFEDERERAYAAAHPDLYAQLNADENKTCLNRIRNCGSISEAQEAQVRQRLSPKKAPSTRSTSRRYSASEIDIARDRLNDPEGCSEAELAWARRVVEDSQ
jgi:hypothetical protein